MPIEIPNQDTENGLFIRTPIEKKGLQAYATVQLDSRYQGWLELPHGGVLMSMLLELAHRGLARPVFHPDNYPLNTSFRLGGPSLLLDQTVKIAVEQKEDEILGWVKKDPNFPPSLTSKIIPGRSDASTNLGNLDLLARAMDKSGRDTRNRAIPLPYTRSCFVCGSERKEPGLSRRFYCLETEETRIAFTFMGLDPDDQEKLSRFCLADGQFHPGTLAAIVDETLGWAGFLHTRQGGVTVRLEMDLFRPVEPGEKMLCFGACSGTRGKGGNRLLWYAEGGIIPMGEEEPFPIMLARGQWLAVPKLTEEMKAHLIPSEWTNRWFTPESM